MKFSPRPVLCFVCLFAVVAIISFDSSSPAWGVSNEGEIPAARAVAEFDNLDSEDDAELEEENRFGDDDFERDDFEDEEDSFADDQEELEIELAERQALKSRVSKFVEVATDESLTAAYVLEEFVGLAEPQEAVLLLTDAANKTKRPVLKRMIRIKLIELYVELDQLDDVREIAHDLIIGS